MDCSPKHDSCSVENHSNICNPEQRPQDNEKSTDETNVKIDKMMGIMEKQHIESRADTRKTHILLQKNVENTGETRVEAREINKSTQSTTKKKILKILAVAVTIIATPIIQHIWPPRSVHSPPEFPPNAEVTTPETVTPTPPEITSPPVKEPSTILPPDEDEDLPDVYNAYEDDCQNYTNITPPTETPETVTAPPPVQDDSPTPAPPEEDTAEYAPAVPDNRNIAFIIALNDAIDFTEILHLNPIRVTENRFWSLTQGIISNQVTLQLDAPAYYTWNYANLSIEPSASARSVTIARVNHSDYRLEITVYVELSQALNPLPARFDINNLSLIPTANASHTGEVRINAKLVNHSAVYYTMIAGSSGGYYGVPDLHVGNRISAP